IRPGSSNRVSTETYAARSTSTKEKKLTSPPSRRSFAKRSPSTALASRSLVYELIDRVSSVAQEAFLGIVQRSFKAVMGTPAQLVRPASGESPATGAGDADRSGMRGALA